MRKGTPRTTLRITVLLGAILSGCSTPPPPVAEAPALAQIEQLNDTGLAAMQRGQIDTAADQFKAALTRARAVDNARAIAAAAYNLAACRLMQGQAESAIVLLIEAQNELRRAGQNAGDVLLLRAQASRAAGDAAGARSAAQGVLDDAATNTPARARQAHLLLGLLASDTGNADTAEQELRASRTVAAPAESPGVIARDAELEGHIARLRKQPAAAANAFERQAGALRSGGLEHDLPRALANAAEQRASVGDTPAAREQWYLAARSLLAQGKTRESSAIFLRCGGMLNTEASDQSDLARRINALRDELRQAGAKP